MRSRTGLILVASFATAGCLFADFSYQQSTKITGGAMAGMMNIAGAFAKQAREPNVTTVAVKGNRLLHTSARQATITDLDKETITTVHFDQKTYSVMTFEQMKQMMEQASARMAGARGDDSKTDASFHVSMKDTGQKKKVAGFDAHEVVMTLEMAGADKQSGTKGSMTMTSDMWLAPKIAGYDEVRDFHRRMGQKLNWTPGGGMPMMGRPEMAKGMAEIAKESAKLDGVPVLQVTKMGGAASGMPTADGGPADASASLMEMTTELTGFSSAAVDASKFEVPPDFKQVEPQSLQRRRR